MTKIGKLLYGLVMLISFGIIINSIVDYNEHKQRKNFQEIAKRKDIINLQMDIEEQKVHLDSLAKIVLKHEEENAKLKELASLQQYQIEVLTETVSK